MLAAQRATGLWCPIADYSQVDLIHGAGKITLDDQPLAGAVVTFEDPADDTFSYAMTDDQRQLCAAVRLGNERRQNRKESSPHQHGSQDPGLNSQPGKDEGNSASHDRKNEKVPRRYNRNSELTADITKGSGPLNFN